MQLYILTQIRQGIKSGFLSIEPFLRQADDGYNDTTTTYSMAEIFLSEPDSDLYKETTDFCMLRYKKCWIELYSFYLFKQYEQGTNAYGEEMLQDYGSFEPYLPIF